MKNENAFKQKLYSHTLPVRDELWEAIEARLPATREKRRFPFFWLILFSSAIAGGALMFGVFRQGKPLQTVTPTMTASINGATSTIPTAQMEAHEDELNPPESSVEARSQNNSKHDLDEVDASASGSISPVVSSSARSTLNTNQAALQHKARSGLISLASKNDERQTVSSSLTKTGIERSEVAVADVGSSQTLRDSRITDALTPTTILLEDGDKFPFFNLQPDPHCYTFGGYATGFALSADLVAGPGFSVRSFEDTGGESLLYADARENTERKQYAWTLGGRLNLHLNNGLGAKIGLSYHQAGDILDYRDSLATQSSTRIDSFWASDGTFLYADTVRVFIPGTLVKKIHNTYRQLDIPLLLSYELILYRSILMINAGPVLNLTSSHKGQILDTALHPRPLYPGGTPANQVDAYKTQLGISLYLGAGVLFPLGSHTSVLLEPRFLYRIKPVTLPQYSLKEHRHFAGLHLGLRYHFN